MKLTVENFGPIQSAEVDLLKPMTVFVGPSNTGKILPGYADLYHR